MPDTVAHPHWKAAVRTQLKAAAAHTIESLSPRLFWALKIRWWRRASADFELRVAPLLCDKRRISVDVGAALGSFSANMCTHSASCIAFEARPEHAGKIREMAAATRLPIQVESVALSDRAGFAEMRILTRDVGRSTIESANTMEDPDGSPRTSIRVPTKRLDDYELKNVGFVKIDVEGHELAVLHGAIETIRQSMPNLLIEIEERHRSGTVGDVSTLLTGFGYEGFFVLDGAVISLSRFDKSVHQDPANAAGWKEGWKCRGVYVNNFFFLRAGTGDVLSNAVSAVELESPQSNTGD